MARIQWLNGISIAINSSGAPLTEYSLGPPDPQDLPDDVGEELDAAATLAAKTATWYVESITDAEFSIHLQVRHPYRFDHAKVAFEIAVDGKLAASPHCARPDYFRNGKNWTYEVEGMERKINARRHTVQNFRFKEIMTRSDVNENRQKIEMEKKRMSDAGDIIIKVYRKTFGKTAKPTSKSMAVNKKARILTSVSEQALKGKSVSHGTAYEAEAKVNRPMKKWDAEYKDGVDDPLAVFHFMYRSRLALQHERIIPRDDFPAHSPSPTANPAPATLDDKLQNLSAEQRIMLAKLLGLSENPIKRERDDDADGSFNTPKKLRRERMEGKNVVIDLSDDDEDEEEENQQTQAPQEGFDSMYVEE